MYPSAISTTIANIHALNRLEGLFRPRSTRPGDAGRTATTVARSAIRIHHGGRRNSRLAWASRWETQRLCNFSMEMAMIYG